jgi:hypothetical protein
VVSTVIARRTKLKGLNLHSEMRRRIARQGMCESRDRLASSTGPRW